MRRNNLLVFDEFIPKHSPAVVTFSPAELNKKLGRFDQLAAMVIVDNLNGHTDGFDVWLAHSADNRGWIYRGNETMSRVSLNGNVHWIAGGGMGGLDETTTNVLAYLDGGASPLLEFVRFEMAFSGTTTAGHVRIYVTQRDQGA